MSTTISIIRTKAAYPKPPFDPPELFPELPRTDIDESNEVYSAVRDALHLLGLDEASWGTKLWSPFCDLIRKGDTVVLKPNLVISNHRLGDQGLHCSNTHASILRPVVDYCIKAGAGKIIIAEAPLTDTDMEKALAASGIPALVKHYADKDIQIEVIDLRIRRTELVKNAFQLFELPGDPRGYTTVDLKEDSELAKLKDTSLLRSTAVVYEDSGMQEIHNQHTNKYSISNTVLSADVFINLPKLKTHKKAGITVSLKNLIGITDEKRWLPHHRIGSRDKGGDEYPDSTPARFRFKGLVVDKLLNSPTGRYGYKALKPIYAKLKKLGIFNEESTRQMGEWYGNDTIWRTILDLNKILIYADKDGVMHDTRQRRIFSIVDGIIAGEKNGPLDPSPKGCGTIIAGADFVAVDMVCARLMGYDYMKDSPAC